MDRFKRSEPQQRKSLVSEARRAQIRQAQKSYHARKKHTFETLETRAIMLEETTQDMCKVLLNLNDSLLTSEAFKHQSGLVGQLQGALQETLSLASKAIPDGEDESTSSGITSPMETSPSSPLPSVSSDEKSRVSSEASLNFTSFGHSGELQLPPFTITLNPLHETDVFTRHPLASLLFPHMEHWSQFARRLRWKMISTGFTSLLGQNGQAIPLGNHIFRFALEWHSREDILRSICFLFEYQPGGPVQDDGSMLLVPRPFCISKQASPKRLPSSPEGLKRGLERFLQGCWDLHQYVVENVLTEIGMSLEDFLQPPELEQYLLTKAAKFRSDGFIEVPVVDTGAKPVSPMTGIQSRQDQLTAEATWILQPTPTSTENTQRSDRSDPLLWMEPQAMFPVETSQAQTSSYPSTPQQSSLSGTPSTLVSSEALSDALAQESVCIGSGGRIPISAIDAVVQSFSMIQAF